MFVNNNPTIKTTHLESAIHENERKRTLFLIAM
jgi:hypothetical protein